VLNPCHPSLPHTTLLTAPHSAARSSDTQRAATADFSGTVTANPERCKLDATRTISSTSSVSTGM